MQKSEVYAIGMFSPNKFKTAQEANIVCAGILHRLEKDTLTKSHYSLSQEGVLQTAQNQIVVPKKLRKAILQKVHDTKVGGHKGKDKTLEMLKQHFWWPKCNH